MRKQKIIARTFMADDIRWIVDYKSSDIESGETEAAFIAREMESYKAQLLRYQNLSAIAETMPIKTAPYLISIEKLVETV